MASALAVTSALAGCSSPPPASHHHSRSSPGSSSPTASPSSQSGSGSGGSPTPHPSATHAPAAPQASFAYSINWSGGIVNVNPAVAACATGASSACAQYFFVAAGSLPGGCSTSSPASWPDDTPPGSDVKFGLSTSARASALAQGHYLCLIGAIGQSGFQVVGQSTKSASGTIHISLPQAKAGDEVIVLAGAVGPSAGPPYNTVGEPSLSFTGARSNLQGGTAPGNGEEAVAMDAERVTTSGAFRVSGALPSNATEMDAVVYLLSPR